MEKRKLLVIICLGFGLRIFRYASRPLYVDEKVGTYRFSALTPAELFQSLPYLDTHPPLYYLFIHYWRDIFDSSLASTRFPAVVFGTLTILGIYFVTREIKGDQAALIASFLLAISPYHIAVSQYAREYALFTCAVVFSFYFLFRLFNNSSVVNRAGYIITTAVMASVHLYGPFLVIGQWMILAIFYQTNRIRLDNIRDLLIFQVAAAILASPILFTMARMAFHRFTTPSSLGQNNLPTPWVLVRTSGTYVGGRYWILGAAFLFVGFGILSLLYLLNSNSILENSTIPLFDQPTDNRVLLILGCWGIPVILFPVIISYSGVVIWDGRSTIGAFLALLVFVSVAVSSIRYKTIKWGTLTLITLTNIGILYFYYTCYVTTGLFFCQ
jgi:uncharacterized membrane protein